MRPHRLREPELHVLAGAGAGLASGSTRVLAEYPCRDQRSDLGAAKENAHVLARTLARAALGWRVRSDPDCDRGVSASDLSARWRNVMVDRRDSSNGRSDC